MKICQEQLPQCNPQPVAQANCGSGSTYPTKSPQQLDLFPAPRPASIPVDPALRGVAEEMLAERKFDCYLGLFDSHRRLPAFLDLAPALTNEEYWPLVRSVWMSSETLYPHAELWFELLQAPRGGRERLMIPSDRRALARMPEELRLYRGCNSEEGIRGLSWTPDLATAIKFAHYSCGPRRRFLLGGLLPPPGRPRVAVATCAKVDVLAYFSGRREHEIVVNPAALTINPGTIGPAAWAP